MGLYSRYVLPRVVHLTCGSRPTMRQREKIVPRASGRVLEIGLGSGLNLPYYDPALVTELVGLDPSPEITDLASDALEDVEFVARVVESGAEDIPLEDDSFDTLVMTYTLCSIPDPIPAVREMARVLTPDGRLLFCEHGAAPDASVRRWQDRVDPLWRRLGGGCRLNRAIPDLIEAGGFTVSEVETMYIPGWRPACYNYWGTAVRSKDDGGAPPGIADSRA